MSENNRNKPGKNFREIIEERIRKAKEQAEIRMAEMEHQKKEDGLNEHPERN